MFILVYESGNFLDIHTSRFQSRKVFQFPAISNHVFSYEDVLVESMQLEIGKGKNGTAQAGVETQFYIGLYSTFREAPLAV